MAEAKHDYLDNAIYAALVAGAFVLRLAFAIRLFEVGLQA
jgi:hypothetical protein